MRSNKWAPLCPLCKHSTPLHCRLWYTVNATGLLCCMIRCSAISLSVIIFFLFFLWRICHPNSCQCCWHPFSFCFGKKCKLQQQKNAKTAFPVSTLFSISPSLFFLAPVGDLLNCTVTPTAHPCNTHRRRHKHTHYLPSCPQTPPRAQQI